MTAAHVQPQYLMLAITALTRRNVKQITIEVISRRKTRCIARFLCHSMALEYIYLLMFVRFLIV